MEGRGYIPGQYQAHHLLYAATEGNADFLEEFLLRNDVRVDIFDLCGRTPLMHASHLGHTRIVHILCEHGANVNIGDPNYTASAVSIHGENMAMASTTFVSPPRTPHDCRTALSFAANRAIARILLDRGACPNARDTQGNTAIMWAAYRGQMATVEILLERGAIINGIVNAFGLSAYDVCCDPFCCSLIEVASGPWSLLMQSEQHQGDEEEAGAHAVVEADTGGLSSPYMPRFVKRRAMCAVLSLKRWHVPTYIIHLILSQCHLP